MRDGPAGPAVAADALGHEVAEEGGAQGAWPSTTTSENGRKLYAANERGHAIVIYGTDRQIVSVSVLRQYERSRHAYDSRGS
ncbi:hypothetical protein SGFS_011540 [Streptomyces graminofaciens]|uniref:Uncharacterized protein n=1 Tax=Streptomyces graminofaciens TaxID=68212 RepID=A0ABM7F2I3_9ACTN|nr:hypothetical protein SGFS_011540 [Streptomyces graminofaciens]